MSPQNFVNRLTENHKIWFYGFSKKLKEAEIIDIEKMLEAFVEQWTSHGKPVKAKSYLVGKQLIVFTVDNSFLEASGCSIDSSVNLIREINSKYHLDIFNRLKLGVLVKGQLEYFTPTQIREEIISGNLSEQSLCVNEQIVNSSDHKNMIIPINQSWLSNQLQNA